MNDGYAMSEDDLDDLLDSLDSDHETETSKRRKHVSPESPPRKKQKRTLNACGKEASDRRKMDSRREIGWTSDNFDSWCEKSTRKGSAKKRTQASEWDLPEKLRRCDISVGRSPTSRKEKKSRGKKQFDPWAFKDEQVDNLANDWIDNIQNPTGVREFKHFQKKRHEYTSRLFEIFNKYIFEDAFILQENLYIDWTKSLNKTAGQCCFKKNSKKERVAVVKLASKILDTYEKLKQTLCHELIHAYTWVIMNQPKPPHGPPFQKWARKAHEVFPDLNVTTCHSYEIHYKYQWQCTNPVCGKMFGRHSKSIKIEKVLCGKCRKGRLKYLGRNKR